MTSTSTVEIRRPDRWSSPFGGELSDADVAAILMRPPFNGLDLSRFREPFTLDAIIRHDTRLVHYRPGELVIRAGDYGNSAYVVIDGTVRVINPPGLSDAEMLREPPRKKGLVAAVAQLWRQSRVVERRDPDRYRQLAERLNPGDSENEVHVMLQDFPTILSRHDAAILESGAIFGEVAALGRTPRTATVVAETTATLVEIRWQGLRELLDRDHGFYEHINNIYRSRNLVTQLRLTGLFGGLSAEQLQQVADAAIFEFFGKYDWFGEFKSLVDKSASERMRTETAIAKQGDYADGLLLIRSGFARVTRRHNRGEKTVSYLGSGGIFGLRELLDGRRRGEPQPLLSTLRAVGHTQVIRVPTHIVEHYLFDALPREKLDELASLAVGLDVGDTDADGGGEAETVASEAQRSGLMEWLLDRRYVNGRQTMLVNLDNCIHCDACAEACATAHDGNPRFNRHGEHYGPLMVANACMHCADPVCMIGCPTGAIHRMPDGQVVINDDTCIGCATCANSCPYNNIRMVEVRDVDGRVLKAMETQTPVLKATKCDLCVEQPIGPACERACPHDALRRVDMRDLRPVQKWLKS